QFDPVKLAADLRLQMRRQRPTVARAQGLKSGPPVATQRRIAGDALREQKALDPVHMPDALIDQGPPFAAKPAAILLLRRGRNNHRTDPWLPALVGQKRPQQRLAIQPVRLGPPAPARRCDRSRIDDVALDPLLLQNAVKPDPIQPRLLDRDARIALAGPHLGL